jgi:hypothetical protein
VNATAARLRLSLTLLTERRLALFATLDGFFLLAGLTMAFSSGNSAADFYGPMFGAPALLIGIPMLAETVAVERRSGTLDLALTSPGARFYFERRAGAVAALMIAQGWLAVIISRIAVEKFPVVIALVQIVIASAFVGAAALNWSVRLKTSGAVVFATAATIAAFSPWFFSNPIHPPAYQGHGPMTIGDYVEYARVNVILGGAAIIFYLYARQRLSNPESIIT